MVPSALIRNVAAAGVAAFVVAFSQMDANPSLFIWDKIVDNDRQLDRTFRGKTLWITGASSGIGADLAICLSNHGANLILTARPSARLQAVAAECQQRQISTGYGSVKIVPSDLSCDFDGLEKTVDTVIEGATAGRLDYVILNAGVGQLRPSSITGHNVTKQLFQINTLAPIALTSLLTEKGVLKKDGTRHLVVTSSVAGKFGVPLSASYAASKHALHGYYNSLKAELPWLRVDLVCPGSTETNFHSNHIGGSGNGDNAGNKSLSKTMKMLSPRCSQLILSSILMHSRQGGEFWIAEQPVLLGLYVNMLFPGLFQKALSKVGPARVKAWEAGLDLYDPETWKKMKSVDDRNSKK